MTSAVRALGGLVLTMSFSACSAPVSPAAAGSVLAGTTPVAVKTPSPSVLPAWIAEPATLPDGKVGKNNCTFAFVSGSQWDAHPEGGCWERVGVDGWTRQQIQKIHVPNFASCGGGPGDATAIRVCRAGGAGQPSPCTIDLQTGPNGCARCVINPTCH